jgi:hypothetical protein
MLVRGTTPDGRHYIQDVSPVYDGWTNTMIGWMRGMRFILSSRELPAHLRDLPPDPEAANG